MSEAITIALISSILPLIGTILTVLYSASKTDEKIKVNIAVMETKIEDLTREVRSHNDFAKRVPVLESRTDALEKRVDKLEAEK